MPNWRQTQLTVKTKGRSTLEITQMVESFVVESQFSVGITHVFLQHTSASLMLCENADSTVRDDLETIMTRLAPDGDPIYRHNYEGDDDMAAHARSVLTTNQISVPIVDGKLGLGVWQGIYLWEHRYQPHERRVLVTLQGV